MKKLFNWINKWFKKKASAVIGIDVGTVNTLICVKDKGIVLNEASVVSFTSENNENVAHLYGNDAKALIGKTPFKIEVVKPIEDGVISNLMLSENMIRHFITTVNNSALFLPIVIAGVPFSATDVEKKALQDILERSNVKDVYLIYESIASALGANLPIDQPIGSLVIDIGGGTTEMSVISLNGIIKNKTFKYGGRKIDEAIAKYIEHKYDILIGQNTAEDVKKRISALYLCPSDEIKKISIYGRNLKTNVPQEIFITQEDMVTACAEFTNFFIENLNDLLSMTPPELMKDILKNGVTVCGGGANVANIDYVIKTITGLDTYVPKNPELCLIKGLNLIIEDYKKYDYLLFKQL